MKIAYIIWIVGIALFPLSLLFANLDITLTNEIWDGPKYESIGKMTLNSGETHSFNFTVMDKPHISLSIKISPKEADLTSQYFSQSGELVNERILKDNHSHVMFVKSSQYPFAKFEYGETYKGIIENNNDIPVEFDGSIRTTETPPRPENYKMFQVLAVELFMLPIPVLILGVIVFVAEKKFGKQIKT